MADDTNIIDPSEPIDNHPNHKKFYLDEANAGPIAEAVTEAIREQEGFGDDVTILPDTVDIDASDGRFKVGATIIEEQPIEYAPFGEGDAPLCATNDDVRHSVVDGKHYLWSYPHEEAPTLATYATMTTASGRAKVTDADLRENEVSESDDSVSSDPERGSASEVDHRSPKEILDEQFTYTVIDTSADGCDLYVAYDEGSDPAIDEIDLPEGWDVCEREGGGLEFISPDTELYAYGFLAHDKEAKKTVDRRDNIHFSQVGRASVVWSPEKIDDKLGDKTPRTMGGKEITPKTLRENLVE